MKWVKVRCPHCGAEMRLSNLAVEQVSQCPFCSAELKRDSLPEYTDIAEKLYSYLENSQVSLEQAARMLETSIKIVSLIDEETAEILNAVRNDISTHVAPVSEDFLRYRHCHSFIDP
ncbi:MAG: hypothetical protein JRJ09_18805 [Deltaproteobacteria bacterium]|nr:hypothetical protein [Deltaproteobacteria bacterium]